jgi:hypothetical protein
MSKNKTKRHRHKKHKTRNKTRIKTKSHNKPKTKTRKITRSLNIRQDVLLLPNRTPQNINELSQDIDDETTNKSLKMIDPASSYSPSVNKELVLLESVQRKDVHNCNNSKAFLLEEPLQIGIPGFIYGKYCHDYDSPEAKKFLLKNLAANKHVNPSKIVPPIQSLANCWFNTMFVTLFVSDKGRKFFHFFRQLMIEGKQSGGQVITDDKLKNGFALLNYAIDACLTGSKYAYTLNTNAVIHQIYAAIPPDYKSGLPYIKDINEAGNPIRYYMSLLNYLNNNALQMIYVSNANTKWKEQVVEQAKNLPHVIIIEFFNDNSDTKDKVINKAISFDLNGHKYALDSAVIRDTSKQHFCATLTCEKKEMAYDGMSFHRLVKMDWKKHINSDFKWQFLGSTDNNRRNLTWNFTNAYQLLVYYRVQ